MKFVILAAALFAVALARPQVPSQDAQAHVVSQQSEIAPDLSNYQFS